MVSTSFFDKLDFQPGTNLNEFIKSTDIGMIVIDILKSRQGTVIEEINVAPLKKVIKFDKNI